MKTVRSYTIFLEGITLILLALFGIVTYFAIKNVLIDDIEQDQKAQMGEIDQYLNSQLRADIEEFTLFKDEVIALDGQSDLSRYVLFLEGFSDLYRINDDFEITELIKRERQSVLFEGYIISSGEIATFLKGIEAGEVAMSPLIRSPERDTVSTYVAFKEDTGYLVGRLSLERLNAILSVVASARGISVTIASPSGYVISSTADVLPFEVVPNAQGLITLRGTEYILVTKTLEMLGNNMVVLMPFENVSGVIDLFSIAFPVVFIAIFIIVLLKLILYNAIVTQPLKRFSDNLAAWNSGDLILHESTDMLKTKELRTIAEVFNEKSAEINAYIEELQDLNRALENREAQYRDLVENVDDLMYTFDMDGRILTLNSAMEKVLNRERSRVIGKHILDLVRNNQQENFVTDRFNFLKETLQRVEFQYTAKDVNHKTRHYKIIWIPRLDEFGHLEQVIGAQNDITELINAQESLKRIYETEKKLLENAISEKDETITNIVDALIEKEKLASLAQLVSGVAHEINTPLGVSVLANSYLVKTNREIKEVLATGELTLEGLHAFIDSVTETGLILSTNLERASELVKSFKEVAVSQNIDEREWFKVKDHVETVLLSMKHEYKNRPIQFEVDIDEGLEIQSYPGAHAQIITNLVMNSLRHGYTDEMKGTIKIAVKKVEHTVRMVYEDDGLGMSDNVVSRIFEPFFTTNRGKGGSGLGLNIVYNTVTGLLGGRITCDSTLGKGTRFEITFTN